MNVISNKREIELYIFKKFIASFDPSILIIKGEFEEQERPDFIIEYNGKTIGVELTQYFTSKASKKPEKVLINDLNSAINLHWNKIVSKPSRVNISYHEPISLSKSEINSTALNIVQKIKQQLDDQCNHSNEFIELEGSSLNTFIDEIRIRQYNGMNQTIISTPGAYQVERLDSSILQEILTSKTEKLKKYDKEIHENWLIIFSSIMEFSDVDIAGFTKGNPTSNFQNTFFFHEFKKHHFKIQ
jgi:hypothetical protein